MFEWYRQWRAARRQKAEEAESARRAVARARLTELLEKEQPVITPTVTYAVVKQAIDNATDRKSRAKEAAQRVISKSDDIIPKDE